MIDMWAYSLWRPWGFAIERLGKRIENRTRPAPSHLHGKRVALHNTDRFDRKTAQILLHHVARLVWDRNPYLINLPLVECASRLEEEVKRAGLWVSRVSTDYPTGITSTAVIEPFSVHFDSDLKRYGLGDQEFWWSYGSVGIVLRDVRVLLEPIPVKGQRSQPWKLPAEIAERVRAAEAVPA